MQFLEWEPVTVMAEHKPRKAWSMVGIALVGLALSACKDKKPAVDPSNETTGTVGAGGMEGTAGDGGDDGFSNCPPNKLGDSCGAGLIWCDVSPNNNLCKCMPTGC